MLRASALVLLAVTASGGPAPPSAPDERFDVHSYAVTLRPELTTAAITGTQTIVLQSNVAGLDRLRFSPNGLQITGATLNGARIAVVSAKDGIVFTLARPLVPGRPATLRFRMAGTPGRGLTVTPAGLYADYFACDWMVCRQDTPADKAMFSLDLVLPPGTASLGVGRALPARRRADGLIVQRWRATRPNSSYLFAFAAGRFAQRTVETGGDRLTYLDLTGGDADLSRLFAQTPAMIAFLSAKAGMTLPDRRYTQVLVPGATAQEAAGFSLIGQEPLAQERDDPARAWVVVHELAHQWWGNLVTCASWRDFWLNEGIATFMTAAWQEHSRGAAAYQAELDVARRRVERVRALGFDKPLAWAGAYPSLAARRAVQYSKGALFLDHLRQSLGDAAFWDGLRRFTGRHAGGVATSRDFQTAMEAASGRDLSATFADWVYGA